MPQDRKYSHIQPKLTGNRSKVLIAAGGNLPSDKGTPAQTIVEATKIYSNERIKVLGISRFFKTPCFPPGAGPDYVNVALIAETGLSASEMLAALHMVEAEFGRQRDKRWGMRTLDLDLLSFDAVVVPDLDTVESWMNLPLDAQVRQTPDTMLLPHPRIQDRAFVLVPLMDVAPDWVHPVLQRSVREMHDALPLEARQAVIPL